MTEESHSNAETRLAVMLSWALLVVRLLARGYLSFLVALALCATVPMVSGLTATVVQSGSMMPHIGVGDVVLSRPLPASAPVPLGRVVTFQAPSGSAEPGIRLHRITGTNPDGSLVTAGDANRDADSAPLDRADIIAVGCILVPWIGLPAFWLQHGAWVPFAGWLALTLLAFLIEFLASRAETQERRKARRIGAESALSIVSLVLCTALVAIAPFTPAVNAAFTATTTNLSNSWVAAISVTPAKLVFVTNPSGSTGGVAFGIQPAVSIQTSSGGVTSSTAAVTLQITTPAGASLSCGANPLAAVAGVATFSGCAIDKAGTYTLTASSAGLTSAVSSTLIVTIGPASRLVFNTSPANTVLNTAFTNQPVVSVRDAGGNTVTASSASVLLSLNGTAGGSLTRCAANPKTAVAGVATFSGCRVGLVGSYTLTATSSSLTSATSASFSIFTYASKLVFVSSPSSSESSVPFSTQPTVAIQDSSGHTTSGTNSITLAITTPNGATIVCTSNPAAAINGTATFAGCAIGKAGTYTLTATTGGLSSAVSTGFVVSAGPAARLGFTSSPSNSTSSTAFSTQPVVAVLDAFGNTVTSSTQAVTLALTTPAGATLGCSTNPKSAVAGVAGFAGCRVDKTGSYTVTATASGLVSTVSSSFTISAGAAAQLVVTVSPGNSTRNVAFPIQPVIQIQDAAGNRVSTTALVWLSITSPTGGANLSCLSNPIVTIAGDGTFSGCRIDRAGSYTLTASSGLLTSGVSTSFIVS
ncbi:hypothetical protein BH10ACT6_BH10ACT6_10820 [soil metagenome]